MSSALDRARAAQAKAKGVVASPLQAMTAQQKAALAAQAKVAQQAKLNSGGAKWLADAEVDRQNKQQKKQAAPKGILGKVLGNPIVSTALKPLGLLAVPGKAVVAGAEEVGDALAGRGFSGSDFMTHVKDPGYGAGSIVAKAGGTGNDWLDRGLGFAGDVLTDPFTYLTLGGAKVPGLMGRAALAEKAAASGAHLGEEALEQLVTKVSKYGSHGLDAAERELLQISEPGLRFAGKRIPGTGEIANVIGKTGGSVRNAINDNPISELVRKAGAGRAPETRAAIEKLATGAGEGSYTDAAASLSLHNKELIGKRMFEGTHQPMVMDTGKKLRGNTAATHAVESGVRSAEADQLRQTLRTIHTAANEAGVKIPDLGPNYIPHLQTGTLKEFMGKAKTDIVTETLDSSSGRTAARGWKAGTYTINGKQVHFADGTIKTIQKELQAKFPKELAGKKLFEDNPDYLVAHYLEDVSKDVGKATALKHGLENIPSVVKPLDDVTHEVAQPGLGKLVVDKQEVADAKALHKQAQGAFWTKHADVEQARVSAATATGDLVEKQGGDASALRQLAETPSPRKVKATIASMDDSERKMTDMLSALPDMTDPDLMPTVNVVKDYVKLKASLGPEADRVFDAKGFLETAQRGTFDQEIKTMLNDGWKSIGKNVLGEDVAVTEQVSRALENVHKLVDTNGFWKAVDNYTKFFKAYATMTPGFHVRNAMDSTFKNAADGVALESIMDGPKLWRTWRKEGLDAVKQEAGKDADLIEDAIKATYGSGAGGQYSSAELGHALRETSHPGSKILDKITHNKLTTTSAAMGERVEGSARLGMALDTLRKGGSVEEAIARIKRVHFDYSEVNGLDTMMKRLIPFWTFMSRNVPLQIQQMWLKPNIYLKWESAKRNLSMQDPDAIVPTGIAERNGIMLGDGGIGSWAFTPDLSQNRLDKDIAAFQDPIRFLANANPLLRVPAELIAGKNFYNDYPINPDQFEGADNELFPLRFIPGMTETAGNGDTVVDAQKAYFLRNMLPFMSTSQRLAGTGEYYGEREGQSALNFLGIPVQKVTKAGVEREKAKRTRDAKPKKNAHAEALRRYGS